MTDTSQVVYHGQCPHCATISKISHTQLQSSKGLVQCSHCNLSFPARGHLLKPDAAKALMAEQAIPTPAPTQAPADTAPVVAAAVGHTLLDDIFDRLAAEAHTAAKLKSTKVVATDEFELPTEETDGHDAGNKKSGSGMFAKLLSRKNQKQTNDSDNGIIFESITEETISTSPDNGFLRDKAKLHVDTDVPAAAVISETIASSVFDELLFEEPVAADKRPVSDVADNIAHSFNNASKFHRPAPQAQLKSHHTIPPTVASTPTDLQDAIETPRLESAFVFELPEDTHANGPDLGNDALLGGIANSKLQSLLVREQLAERQPISEAEVLAPDYDANKQWFTQFFNALNQGNADIMVLDRQAAFDHSDEELVDGVPTAKRMHEPSGNTVAMRLPENSMLVFTLEDEGNSHSQLSFIDIQERVPHKSPEPNTQVIHHTHHNEHTMWTVACIVAILILIIQMFYYFLLLTP